MRVVSAVAILILAAACSGGDDVSGLWETPTDVAPITAGALSGDVPVRFRLAAAQYGKDVSGVLLLYSDDLFHTLEACRYLENAEVKSGHLLFSIAGAGEEDDLAVDLLLGDRDGDEALEGLITGQDKPVPMLLVGKGDAGNIHEEGLDLGCPQR